MLTELQGQGQHGQLGRLAKELWLTLCQQPACGSYNHKAGTQQEANHLSCRTVLLLTHARIACEPHMHCRARVPEHSCQILLLMNVTSLLVYCTSHASNLTQANEVNIDFV